MITEEQLFKAVESIGERTFLSWGITKINMGYRVENDEHGYYFECTYTGTKYLYHSPNVKNTDDAYSLFNYWLRGVS